MGRLNEIRVGYLKDVPMEEIPDMFVDAVINELGGDLEMHLDEFNSLQDILKINYLVVQFLDQIRNNNGIYGIINSDLILLREQLMESLKEIGANETVELLEQPFTEVDKLDFDDNFGIDIENETNLFYACQDFMKSMALSYDEPVYDYLIRYNTAQLEGLDEEELI